MGKHLCKFKVGDFIAANETSDSYYSITNHKNQYLGYVCELIDVTEAEFEAGVADIVVGSEKGRPDFSVRSSCFDLAEPETVVPPDGDLFARLF